MTEDLKAQRPMRGYRVIRCDVCKLPAITCICAHVPKVKTKAQIWLIMNEEETRKPTNTGRLISDAIPETKTFIWSRVEPNKELLSLLENPIYDIYVVFPDDKPEYKPRVKPFVQHSDKIPVFIIIDGTWVQARKIYKKSPYLEKLPLLPLCVEKESDYKLRRPSEKTHICTVEVAVELLKLNKEFEASEILDKYFHTFLTHYLSGRANHKVKDN